MKSKTLIITIVIITIIALYLYFIKHGKDNHFLTRLLTPEDKDTSDYADIADMTYDEVVNFIKENGLPKNKNKDSKYFYEIYVAQSPNDVDENESMYQFGYVDYRQSLDSEWVRYNISKDTYLKLEKEGYDIYYEH